MEQSQNVLLVDDYYDYLYYLRIFRKRKDPDAGTCDTASNTVT
jgi:hypothetical protein